VNRVLLINKTKAPTRQELTTSERRAGELLFAPHLDKLRYAGYVIVTGRGTKAANWIITDEHFAEFLEWTRALQTHECPDYEIQVFTNGKTPHGGQTEVLVA
jgi:hypothetical protein